MAEWRNWSGSVVASPSAIESPTTEAELQRLVAAAAKVRVAGTGHSFMPLCATDGLMLSLADLNGDVELAPDGQSAWVPAGMAIGRLTEALWARGYSLINLISAYIFTLVRVIYVELIAEQERSGAETA